MPLQKYEIINFEAVCWYSSTSNFTVRWLVEKLGMKRTLEGVAIAENEFFWTKNIRQLVM